MVALLTFPFIHDCALQQVNNMFSKSMHRATQETTPLHFAMFLGVFLVIGSLSHAQADRNVAQFKTACERQESRCKTDIRQKDWSRSRQSCDACYTACIVEPLRNDTDSQNSAEQCLKQCVGKNCGHDPSGVDQLKGVFACRYYGRRCFHDFHSNRPSISESCPKCISLCPPFDTSGRNDTKWCTDRCNERNCIRGPSTTPPPSTSAKPSSTGASPTGETNPKPEATSSPTAVPAASPSKPDSGPWEWLGPVLGAVATIVGAVITVVWVRDFRHARPFSGANRPHDSIDPMQPSAQSNASYDWEGRNVETPYSWDGIGAPPPSNWAFATQD